MDKDDSSVKWAISKLYYFSSGFDETWGSCSALDERQKRLINSPFNGSVKEARQVNSA